MEGGTGEVGNDGGGWETVTRGRKASPHSSKGSRPSSVTRRGEAENHPPILTSQTNSPNVPETTPTEPETSAEDKEDMGLPSDSIHGREKVT